MRELVAILICVGAAMAQPPVAPTTNEPVGPVRGDNFENYNITQSFELGYRFASIGGDVDMYRATVNYMNGVRLLSSSLFVQSRDGHGGWFDQITLNTLGLGGDPYESASLRVEKNGLYRYDMLWRENAFFDPALTISYGEHLRNTTRTMQDHDLTLFPQSNYKIFLGYSRNVDDGPALSTIQLFNSRGNEYPLFADIHDQQNEYRLGGEAVLLGFRLNVLHSWVDFKEDTPTNIFYTPELGNNPGSGTLTAFTRAEPYHGTSPYWRVGLFREGKRLWAVNGRFTYVDSQRGFIDNEFASGSNLFGNLTAQQILSFGNARRPSLAANLNVTLFPRTNVTITNQSTYNDKRTVGDAVYSQYLVGTLSSPVVAFTYLGIRDFANSTNVEVRFGKRFAVHAGYQYSDRRIGVISGQQNFGDPAPTPPDNTPISQVNVLNAGILGFRFRPVKAFTILADAEIGRNSQPFTPISDRNYQALRGRAEYKLKSLRFGASARSETNTNSISLTSFASHSRNYGADFSWAPMERFSIDASYSYLHLMTMGGIYFFVNQAAVNGNSIYLSNIHAGNIATRIAVTKRADVFLGYTHTEDVAGTNGTLCAYGAGCIPAVPGEPFNLNQSFPVRFLSPQARLSIRLNNRVRWNAGYQYYGYNQVLASVQNYRAQTGYSSLLWSF